MRRMLKVLGLFSILAALNVATVCVFLSAIPVRAGLQQPGPPCLQGDINGDGNRTLADALKLLHFLFLEGEEPVACAGGEKVDVAAEMEKALARFMPRAEDYVRLRIRIFSDDELDEVTVIEPEDGTAFVLTGFFFSGASASFTELKLNGEVLTPFLSTNQWVFVPGDELSFRFYAACGDQQLFLFRYWLDYEDPEK